MARPIKYDPAIIWPVVLESIANGQSLSAILRQHDFPSYAWAKLHLRVDFDEDDTLIASLITAALRGIERWLNMKACRSPGLIIWQRL